MANAVLKRISPIAMLLPLIACSSHPPRAPLKQEKGDYGYVKTYMTWFTKKEMREKGIIGLSIALVDDQKIVWQQGFGYADLKNKLEATPETRYRAGSISKLFTGMAAMKLVEAGKMDIDHPLVTYLPEFRIKSRFGDTNGITPRTIMTHHSGLPSEWMSGMFTKQPQPFDKLVKKIKNDYVSYPPNTTMSYSNLGVTLLGHAVKNVSGQDYAAFVDQSLLKPMGMINSQFETGISGSHSSKSYAKGKEIVEYPLRDMPAGGLNTTVIDLARLAMLVNNKGKLNNQQIISPATLDAMFQVQNKHVPLDVGNKIGLAWFINTKILAEEDPVFEHDGGTIAHRSSFKVAPKSKLGVIVMANTNSADTGKIAQKLLQMAWEAKNGVELPKMEIPGQLNSSADFEGTYSTLVGKVDIHQKSPNRYKVNTSYGTFNLDREENGGYRLNYRLLGIVPIDLEELSEIVFSTDTISGQHVIIGESNNYRFAGVRLEPHPIHEAWKHRLGEYKLLNPAEVYKFFQIEKLELKIEGDYLVFATPGPEGNSTLVLRTVNAQEAIFEGYGRGLGETLRIIRDEEGEEILIRSGLRYKRIP
ncbi:MAG: serine hydrolase [Candidatus Thiodiazotropha sp.]|jgi:CubicO group peptidase (beta-lactamase class C family)